MVYVGVAFADESEVGPRERAILARLRRVLAPVIREQLRRGEAESPPRWPLTAREREVAELVAAGLTNRQIARRLGITLETVKKHLTHILAKTECPSRTVLAVAWQRRTAG
ncbi:DNA-binding response regulator [Bailinhaonella thermotolerans]|uniref:DNA-binding response regulator n=1 Tax=Bailinhaonella thermotolerans TaxID=1070861 RepID=A0A3A4B7R2_9ACTN|nr:DNA-binding response regulator [Bailinhaonella thermotolerans]